MDIEREAVRRTDEAARREGGRRTIMLVLSRHFGWVGVRASLQELEGIRLVGEAGDAEEATRLARRLQADVILLAADAREGSIVELVRELQVSSPQSKIMVIAEEVDHDLQWALGRTAIAGFTTWTSMTPEHLRAGVEAVLGGWRVTSPEAGDELMAPAERRHRPRVDALDLTARERRVLQALAAGLTNRQIAAQETVSDRTVRRIVETLEGKLGVPNRAALAAKAVELGFGR